MKVQKSKIGWNNLQEPLLKENLGDLLVV